MGRGRRRRRRQLSMNLATEYLTRKGVQQHLFRPPCSLCIEKDGDRRIVRIEEQDAASYRVVHWVLTKIEEGLPVKEEFSVQKSELFSSDKTVVPGFFLESYHEQPIITRYNETRHPMKTEIFCKFVNGYLNSTNHRNHLLIWLWCSFTEQHFARPFQLWERYGIDYSFEQYFVQQEHPHKWAQWRKWADLLHFGDVAGELIFMPYYKQRRSSPAVKLASFEWPF